MKILILEDDPERHKAFRKWLLRDAVTIVETTSACIQKLTDESWDILFLDHDLGGETMVPSDAGTGYEVAQWLTHNPDHLPFTQIILHSYNPVGRENMYQVLMNKFGNPSYVLQAPGCWLKGG